MHLIQIYLFIYEYNFMDVFRLVLAYAKSIFYLLILLTREQLLPTLMGKKSCTGSAREHLNRLCSE